MSRRFVCEGCPDIDLCCQLGFCLDDRAASVVIDDEHPVDILKEVAKQAFPGYEVDEGSFAEAKLALDATMGVLDPTNGPLSPEVHHDAGRKDMPGGRNRQGH